MLNRSQGFERMAEAIPCCLIGAGVGEDAADIPLDVIGINRGKRGIGPTIGDPSLIVGILMQGRHKPGHNIVVWNPVVGFRQHG
jgi:hypothetical protein